MLSFGAVVDVELRLLHVIRPYGPHLDHARHEIWADDAVLTRVEPARSAGSREGWNVGGTVFLTIDGGSGEDCVKLRWRSAKSAFGSSWTECNQATVEVPMGALTLLFVELTAGDAEQPVGIAASDEATVETIELCGRVVEC